MEKQELKKLGITREVFQEKLNKWINMSPNEKIRYNGFKGFLINEFVSKVLQNSGGRI